MNKVFVLCPGDVVTGGPELIHQFVDCLNKDGDVASIVYYPFESDFSVPEPYKHYNVNVRKFGEVNFTGESVVLPEIITGYKRYFTESNVFIWWMSVDNYFKHFPTGIRWLKNKILNLKKSPIPVKKLKDCVHLAQSEYAREFLEKNGLKTFMLSDYLNQEHLEREVDLSKKQNVICYNPLKGIEVTKRLIETYRDYKFIPIKNMTAKEVADLLATSKVYIDFGDHPGKDRIPREAVMAQCVVITGRKGSANNSIDIPIPDKYKIAEDSPNFIESVGNAFKIALFDYENALNDYAFYRERTKNEKKIFENEVKNFSSLLK